MAEIAPFRGLRYNLEKIDDLNRVVTPPYDVISPHEQELFHRASPYNFVHLELGETTPGDSEGDNPHTRAAGYLRQWRESRVLVHDEEPAIYYYELDYPLDGAVRRKRYGFISLLRLEDFRTGSVRPHERTFQAVKDERLRLMLACDANLSPVFALYADPAGTIDDRMNAARAERPAIHFKDGNGMEHRLWPVRDSGALLKAREFLLNESLFIADGHHRYETALNYRALQRERFPGASPRAHFEYIMVYLANMNQPGLTILPTHRLLQGLGDWEASPFLKRAEEFFAIAEFDADPAPEAAWRRALEEGGANKETVIGFCRKGANRLHLLRARKEAVRLFLAGLDIPEVLGELDVVVLDRLLLRHCMALSETFLSDVGNIRFSHDLAEALAGVRSGSFDAGFLINSTRIEQVREVAGAGLVMPHKSTYFYPKVLSGLAIHHPLVSQEEVVW